MISTTTPRLSLDALAWQIRTLLAEPEDRRLTLSLLLKQGKDRIEAGEEPEYSDFWEWCRVEFPDRGERDIRRLLSFAEAPDPAEAIREHRARTAEQTRRWRERRRAAAQPDSHRASKSTAASEDDTDDTQENYGENTLVIGDEIYAVNNGVIWGVNDDAIHESILAHYHRRQRELPHYVCIDIARELLEALGVEPGELLEALGVEPGELLEALGVEPGELVPTG